jgi:virulence-associated protein VagC
MQRNSLSLLLLALLIVTTSLTGRAQQTSFTVEGIKPFDKAVPGQVMEVLIEGLGSLNAPMILPESDFKVEVSQDGVKQKAKVRLTKFTMVREMKTDGSKRNTVDFAGMQMRAYHAVSFVVPKGLHPGPAEVVASYKGKRGNPVAMEIVEKPLAPVVGTTAMLAIGGMPPERTSQMTVDGNDLGWRLERGSTATVSVNPLVDPDDPNSAILIRFKQGGNEYDAVTRVMSTPAKVENHNGGVRFMAAREELEVDVPAAVTLGKAQVEIRVKANGQVSDPVNLTATITDVTRVAETPNVSAPRVLAVTPQKVGAGQALMISVDQRRTLEPSPKETKVVIEKDNARYFATIEHNSALIGPSKEPDAPVAFFVRTTRELIGRVQLRVLNPLRGEQTGMSAPVPLEIVDEVFPPVLTSVSESTDADLARLKQMYETQKQAGREFREYDPSRRYLTVKVRGVDYNPKFIRITLEQGGEKYTLSLEDLSSYSGEALIVRLPKELNAGEVKFTIENSDGERYSTPATKTFVLPPQE